MRGAERPAGHPASRGRPPQERLPLFADGTRNAPWIAYGSERFKTIYKRRSAVEREFGRLKHQYGLAFLRVRGIERVRLHADLTMLGRLALALTKERAAT